MPCDSLKKARGCTLLVRVRIGQLKPWLVHGVHLHVHSSWFDGALARVEGDPHAIAGESDRHPFAGTVLRHVIWNRHCDARKPELAIRGINVRLSQRGQSIPLTPDKQDGVAVILCSLLADISARGNEEEVTGLPRFEGGECGSAVRHLGSQRRHESLRDDTFARVCMTRDLAQAHCQGAESFARRQAPHFVEARLERGLVQFCQEVG